MSLEEVQRHSGEETEIGVFIKDDPLLPLLPFPIFFFTHASIPLQQLSPEIVFDFLHFSALKSGL